MEQQRYNEYNEQENIVPSYPNYPESYPEIEERNAIIPDKEHKRTVDLQYLSNNFYPVIYTINVKSVISQEKRAKKNFMWIIRLIL